MSISLIAALLRRRHSERKVGSDGAGRVAWPSRPFPPLHPWLHNGVTRRHRASPSFRSKVELASVAAEASATMSRGLIVTAALALSACGGGGPVATLAPQEHVHHSHDFHTRTGPAPKIAYAGSPVRKSEAYINYLAIEPGESWLGLGDFGAQDFGGWTWNATETQRIIPILIFEYAPGYLPDPELEAQVRRAFKLWTRHLTGVRGYTFRRWTTVVEVGYANACGGSASALACVVPADSPANPYIVPVMQIPASQAALVASANSPITLLTTLAHEAGHALGYQHYGLGHYNPETGQYDKAHAPSSAGQLMSPFSGDSATIGPQMADLIGIGHTFWYGDALSPEYFGWWLDAPTTSNLRSFGSGVARHFDVADIPAVSGVSADSESVTAASVTSDYVKVSSWVDGVPTPPEYLGRTHLGSATWVGNLLAVDTDYLWPVIGVATLSMDLSALRLGAVFDNLQQGPDFEPWAGPSSLRYSLTESASGVWNDYLGRVDARFFAEFTPAGTVIDPAFVVAGHLDDDQAGILGAYGATRRYGNGAPTAATVGALNPQQGVLP